MQEHNENFHVEEIGDVVIASLGGKILDPVFIESVEGQLNELAESRESPRLVLDFQTVSHLSSSALGMLTTLHQIAQERGGELCLCNIQPAIQEIFQITRLNEVLSIQATRAEAINSVR